MKAGTLKFTSTSTSGTTTTTTTTAPAMTTTVACGTTTVASGTCSSLTYVWSGYQGVNVNAPTFPTGVTIQAPVSGSTAKVTSMVVQTYDAQSAGTVPSRATQNETGEKVGVRIGTTMSPR